MKNIEMELVIMKTKKIDWMITLVPLGLIVVLCFMFFVFPDGSSDIVGKIRFFLGDTLGVYYLIIGLGIFLISMYILKYPVSIYHRINKYPIVLTSSYLS